MRAPDRSLSRAALGTARTVLRQLSRKWLMPRSEAMASPKELSASDAYRLWAPTYADETATSALDEHLAREMLQGIPCTRLLDAGCGIGRRIWCISHAVGIDSSPEMIAAASAPNVIIGDVRQMPFTQYQFDMVWCRLVLGHLPDISMAYRELSRVCAPGGHVFVTDFHQDAIRAGHTRTMTGCDGKLYTIEHYVHNNHRELAEQAGLVLVRRRSGRVGPSVRSFYERGIGLRAYQRHRGLNLVEAILFRKPSV